MNLSWHSFLTGYLLILNLLSFIIFGLDKAMAKQQARRVPEATLLFLALAGGAAGELCAMYAFRHKTRHKKFFIGLPLILLAQLAIFAYFAFLR